MQDGIRTKTVAGAIGTIRSEKMEMDYEQALEHLDAELKKIENVGSRVIQEFLNALKEKKDFKLENFKLLSPKNFMACIIVLQHEYNIFADHVCSHNPIRDY